MKTIKQKAAHEHNIILLYYTYILRKCNNGGNDEKISELNLKSI